MTLERPLWHYNAERCNDEQRGYVALPEHWRYSSAGFYAGLDGLIEMDRW